MQSQDVFCFAQGGLAFFDVREQIWVVQAQNQSPPNISCYVFVLLVQLNKELPEGSNPCHIPTRAESDRASCRTLRYIVDI